MIDEDEDFDPIAYFDNLWAEHSKKEYKFNAPDIFIMSKIGRECESLGLYPFLRGAHAKSLYADIYCKKCNELLFQIRMSDHRLKSHNQIPAGVVSECFTFGTLHLHLEMLKEMSEAEKAELWTNRYKG